MGTIWIKELTGGLDARRLPETTPGGVLVRADNGHITRGGEFETRAAFIPEIQLPAGTVGLAHTRTGLVVFGSDAAPTAMPSNVRYVRLQKGGLTLDRILDWELFEGKIYAVAEYSDGTVAHFYDGVEVEAWQEARARVALHVVNAVPTPAQQATATFAVSAGTGAVIDELKTLNVNDTRLLREPIRHTGDNATTAAAIVAEINDNPMAPRYTAVATGNTVTLTAQKAGTLPNGLTLEWEVTGFFAVSAATPFSGGVDAVEPRLDSLTIGGVPIIRRSIPWTGTANSMAEAIADEIRTSATEPEYEASTHNNVVNIRAVEPGPAGNGRALAFTTTGTLDLQPVPAATEGGAEIAADRYNPADVVLTVREKMYAGANSIFHMSAIQNPRYWVPGGTATDQIGAGFKNIAASNSSSYKITGLARYYDRVAVFTPDTVQTWFLDPDPDLVVQTQVLENTGTECPQSVTQFGDADIFYLDTSGIRSLRARDSSNAAATTDVGVPIDDILADRVAHMTAGQKARVIGLINPADKRFWLILGTEIFVYSYYPNSKVNAWTRYEITSTSEAGQVDEYDVTSALAFDRRVYLRSGNTILVYGGGGRTSVYDRTVAEAWLPMLDANSPTAEKQWRGVDVALSGEWDVSVSYDPISPNDEDDAAVLTETTFGLRRIPTVNKSTHYGLRLRSRGGRGVVSAVVIHFDGKDDED